MRDAVIVSTARTAIGRAYKGGFNNTSGPTLGSYSLAAAVERAGIEGGEIDDVIWGFRAATGHASGQYRPSGRLARGFANQCFGHEYGPPMFIRLDEYRGRRQAGDC